MKVENFFDVSEIDVAIIVRVENWIYVKNKLPREPKINEVP
jgi:hypothetical protein